MVFVPNKKTWLYCSAEMETKYYKANNSFIEKTESLKVIEIINGIVHPLELSETKLIEVKQYGGVTDVNLNFIEESLTKRTDPLDNSHVIYDWYVGANRNRDFADIEYFDDDVVFIGALSKHYGHFILEGLARIWFYLDAKNLKFKCVYISEIGPDLFLDIFKLLKIDPHRMQRIEVPTKFRKVLIPEPSIRLSDYYHQKYYETVSRIRDSVPAQSYNKVFFSKEGISNSRAVGEDIIQSVFESNGYLVFHPEKMSMYEKISILRGAKIFVASSGTNVHNSVFLEDNCDCVCLNRSEHYYSVQFMIGILKKLNNIYIDAYILANRKRNLGPIGPFLFGPTKHLFDFFKINNFKYNKFILYANYPLLVITYFSQYLNIFIRSASTKFLNKSIRSNYLFLRIAAKVLLYLYKSAKTLLIRSKIY
jgi:hypothetical protein